MSKRLSLPLFVAFSIAVALTVLIAPLSMAAQEGSQPLPGPKASSPAEPAAQAPVNLNSASAAELEKLPGIGPKIAEAIVKHRETNGPFKSVDDLKQIKGIGDKSFEKIRDMVAIQ